MYMCVCLYAAVSVCKFLQDVALIVLCMCDSKAK